MQEGLLPSRRRVLADEDDSFVPVLTSDERRRRRRKDRTRMVFSHTHWFTTQFIMLHLFWSFSCHDRVYVHCLGNDGRNSKTSSYYGTKTTGLGSRKKTPLSHGATVSLSTGTSTSRRRYTGSAIDQPKLYFPYGDVQNTTEYELRRAHQKKDTSTSCSAVETTPRPQQMWATLVYNGNSTGLNHDIASDHPILSAIWIFQRGSASAEEAQAPYSSTVSAQKEAVEWEGVSIAINISKDTKVAVEPISSKDISDQLQLDLGARTRSVVTSSLKKRKKTMGVVRKMEMEISKATGNRKQRSKKQKDGDGFNSVSSCIPIEGIYGIYNLPSSGPCLVVILESEPVYTSPDPDINDMNMIVLDSNNVSEASDDFSMSDNGNHTHTILTSTSNTTTSSTRDGLSLSHPTNVSDVALKSRQSMSMPPPILELQRVLRMDIIPIPTRNGNIISSSSCDNSSSIRRLRSISSSSQRNTEMRQLQLLRSAMKDHKLYFVPRRMRQQQGGSGLFLNDVTHTLQRSLSKWTESESTNTTTNDGNNTNTINSSNDNHNPVVETSESDLRFLWNYEPIQNLLNACRRTRTTENGNELGTDTREQSQNNSAEGLRLLQKFTVPCSSMFVGITKNVPLQTSVGVGSSATTNTNNDTSLLYDEVLLSRRSRFRAGTRFTRRGADISGAVANYAETEQIILIKTEEKSEESKSSMNIENNATILLPSPSLEQRGEEKEQCDNNVNNSNSNRVFALQEVYSFVQTRGSIPLRWSSPADVRTYAPKVRIGLDPLEQARSLRAHVLEQLQLYASTTSPTSSSITQKTSSPHSDHKLVFVNLVDKQKDQGRLGRTFDAILNAVVTVHTAAESESVPLDDSDKKQGVGEDEEVINESGQYFDPKVLRHVWYDFHAELKGGKWHKLKTLLNMVTSDLESQGYFAAAPYYTRAPQSSNSTGITSIGWNIQSLQQGVIRTNCMDCLDRTNVVQSIFGRYILFRQLQDRLAKIRPAALVTNTTATARRNLPLPWIVAQRRDPLTLPWSEGELGHRLLWADNADAISRLYAGTPALKGDFTRTGQRTKRGALDDGMNSLTRYYLNNFADVDRQEGMDLMTGSIPFTNVDHHNNHHDSIVGLSMAEIRHDRRAFLRRLERQNNKQHEKHAVGQQREAKSETHDGRRLRRQPQRPLDLRWLPGDLKDMIMGMISSQSMDANISSCFDATMISGIDHRASSHLPWWAIMKHQTGGRSKGGSSSSSTSRRKTKTRSQDKVLSNREISNHLHRHMEGDIVKAGGLLSAVLFVSMLQYSTTYSTIIAGLSLYQEMLKKGSLANNNYKAK
jgi:hypothetical protein